ncbi:MFP2 protein [Aphelenchoides avenae]|nr:MFP2 protein [Aphelenchus avenae]
MATDIASVSYNGKAETIAGGPIQDLLVIFRNLNPPSNEKVIDDQWIDIKYRDKFPNLAVQAADRPLKQEDGSQMNQYVALWYKHGEPVFGRCYPDSAEKVLAHFGATGQENAGAEIGSFQMIVKPPPEKMGMEYKWMTFKEAAAKAGGFHPVHVGDVAPCIVKDPKGGFELLGNVNLKQEKASAGYGGKEKVISGPAVQELLVLCRNP